MNLAIDAVLGLTLAWGLYLAYTWYSSQSIKGLSVDRLQYTLPELRQHTEKALIYCYSPPCGPCKTMTPIVDALRDEGLPIIKLDLPQHLELAHELGIKATPTLLLVRDGRIEAVNVGARSRHQILQLLEA
jgi:thioredoxin-like negative regulator of GroEL